MCDCFQFSLPHAHLVKYQGLFLPQYDNYNTNPAYFLPGSALLLTAFVQTVLPTTPQLKLDLFVTSGIPGSQGKASENSTELSDEKDKTA